MNISNKFKGCIFGGAIGDAYGSGYENLVKEKESNNVYYPFGIPQKITPEWNITDDTQLTLATCEAIINNKSFNPSVFASKYLEYFKKKKITGIGASTLKSLIELEAGGDWRLVGRRGEFAAGNGAAMRIAPLGFFKEITKSQIRDICTITHYNDEAYAGALSVFLAIRFIVFNDWKGNESLLDLIISELPDTRVRDRFIDIEKLNNDNNSVIALGNSGYVVDSVPLAVYFANQVNELGFEIMLEKIVEAGGDTDTNASIAGQVAGAFLGIDSIPHSLLNKLKSLNDDYLWIDNVTNQVVDYCKWN